MFQIKYWVCFQCKINDPNLNHEEMGKNMLDLEVDSWRRNNSSESSYETKTEAVTITSPNVEG